MPSRYENITPAGGSTRVVGSRYENLSRTRTSTSTSKPKKKGASVFGGIGNLWGDVQDSVVGIGTLPVLFGRQAVKEVRKRPYAAFSPLTYTKAAATVLAEPTIESYRYQYGPLARGDVGEFGHRLYEHPLGPILDAATVVSGGAGLAAKAGVAPAALGRGYVTIRTPAGKLVRKPLAKQTLRAEVQVATNAALNRLPSGTPVVGEAARAGKALKKVPLRTARARELQQEPFLRTLGKVRNTNQRTATFWLTQVPLPEDLGRLAAILESQGSDTARATATILRNPKVTQAYANPTPRMLRIQEEAGHVAEAQRALLGITPETAQRRAYMPTLLARGAKFVEQEIPGERLAALERDLERTLRPLVDEAFPPAVRRREQGMRNVLPYTRGKRAAAGLEREIDLIGIPGSSSSVLANAFERIEEQIARMAAKSDADPRVRRIAEMLDERDQLRSYVTDPERVFGDLDTEIGRMQPAPGFGTIDDMIAKIDADLDAAGRPRPVYMPHTSEVPKATNIYGVGGAGPQRRPGPLHQTMGVLLGRGQLIQDPRVLRQSFVKSVKFRLYDDIHRLHVEHAQPVDQLPRGWQFVRRKHSERIPYTAKTAQDFEDFAKSFLDEEGELTPGKPEVEFTTANAAEAMTDEAGRYLAVPQAFSRELAGEFTRSGKFVYLMNKYPVRVWRHLVLKLRPAWLVNNILGNTLLYLVNSADPIALQELGRGFKRAFPRKADAFDDILRKHFPEQVHGTFIGSQLPLSQGGRRLTMEAERAASFVGAGLAQVDRIWEQSLRSSIVRAELRKSPEIRKFAGKMRRDTDELARIADEALSADPVMIERISNRVNDGLGDFMALGRIERDFIRSVFPFYAWFRVITGITLKLPLTHPVRGALLVRLGEAGATSALEELGVPEGDVINYAKGFVPLRVDDDGRVRGISSKAANPFATVADLQEFVAAIAVGKPGDAWEVLPGLNPLYAIPVETLTGGGRARYATRNRFGILGSSTQSFVQSLPQVRLEEALRGNLYAGTPQRPTLTDRDRWDELLRYLGIPYARVSPKRVHELSNR